MPDAPTTTYQLSELTDFIRRVFALNLPRAVWIAAEIGQASVSRDNVWLTLVQKTPDESSVLAQLDGVIWKRQLTKLQRTHGIKLLRDLLQNGMSVRLKVVTSFHQRYGLRLVVEDLDPGHTLGALEQRRRRTLERLSAEGLLGKNGLLRLPPTPLRLAVISSNTAAGLADFQDQLTNNPSGYQFAIKLFTAAMQGARTGTEIISCLNRIKGWPDQFDAIVVVRGGGGRTDLAAFDDEDLARYVADYPLPVITGIGHETDDAVIDRVAHTALKTPTAAAVFLLNRVGQAETQLLRTARSIHLSATTNLNYALPALGRLRQTILHTAAGAIDREHLRLTDRQRQLNRLPAQRLREATSRLDALEQLLGTLRPERTLERGYALVSQDGRLITKPTDLRAGEVEVRLKSGRTTLIKGDERF